MNIVDPTLFGDELLYLLVALHLSRLSTPSEHCSYGVLADSFGKMHVCSLVVLAAEARKAESASVEAQRTPRPPSLTGKDAWSQRSPSKPTFRMVDNPSLSKSSNRAKLGQSAQTAVRILYISFGTLKLFLSRTRASCV